MRLIVAAIAASVLLFAGAAMATQAGVNAMLGWKTMDSCAKEAQERYPDFTAESNAKRDAQLKACLEQNNLPPRQLDTPTSPR
jgi:hypothetical protein